MFCLAVGWLGYGTGEITLAKAVLVGLRKGMLCLADRQFFGFALWQEALATGADLVWRIKTQHAPFLRPAMAGRFV